MRPSTSIQSVLSSLPCKVFGSVPKTVPDTFVLHTVVTSKPVVNGRPVDSMDCSVAVSTVAGSNDEAWTIANKVTELLNDSYESGTGDIAFLEVTSHPVRQPRVDTVTDSTSYQYNAVYRLIFTV